MALSRKSITYSAPGNRLGLGLMIAVAVFVLDQASKWLIMEVVLKAPRLIEITSFFNIRWVWNRGVSFGIFSDGSVGAWVLITLSLVIAVFLFFWLRRTASLVLTIGLGMVLGGALGNVVDRIRFEAVFDFLDFYIGSNHWPTFNIADCGIVIGVGIMFLETFLEKKQ